ncbi:hypothetical protein NQ314_014339, partial [Rhamnusium bicolor]
MITFIANVSLCVLNYTFFLARIPKLDGRVIGGKNASILEFPYQVSVRKYGQHICGGSIFHNSYILTAAHCVAGYLCNPLAFASQILPIALPQPGEELVVGTPALISGWGYENEDGTVATILKQVEIPIVSYSTCQKRYLKYSDLTKNMFCAGL